MRKKLLERLRAIFEYYSSTREIGHTTAMLKGARFSKETLVVVHDEKMANILKRDYDCQYMTLSNLIHLRGQCRPMVIDHYALTILLAGAIECIEAPIDMILPCPNCRTLHVDTPEPGTDWNNPPHKSHLCHICKTIWRPADVATNGVREIQTKGDKDTITFLESE